MDECGDGMSIKGTTLIAVLLMLKEHLVTLTV